MKKFLLFIFLPFLLAGAFTLCSDFMVNQAEAARFGGGRSFGGNRSYRQPTQTPAPSRQQVAPAQNNAVNRGAAPAVGGMRGFLGPLLAGSMLGAMFFGGGFHGFGMADAAFILLSVFLLNRFIRSRRRAAELAAETAGSNGKGNENYYDARSASGKSDVSESKTWDRLRGSGGASPENQTDQADQAEPALRLPEGFDAQEFLAGAKLMFTRMQESWGQRDLDDIAEFTSDPVMEEIARQADEDPNPSHTDILLINARLLKVSREGAGRDATETASVYFEVLMRERREQESFEMREVWHFLRKHSQSWKLDGIQQVAC